MNHRSLHRYGVDVLITDEGEGVPVLLMNGLAAGSAGWAPVRARLGGYRTIAFDPPGSGGTPAARRPLSIRLLADLAADVLDRQGVDAAHVVGYSFGGAVAQELAHRHPHRVRTLTLLCTSFAGAASATDPRVALALLNPRRLRDPGAYARTAARLLGGRARTDPDFRERYAQERVAAAPSVTGYVHQLLAAATWTSLPWLHGIRVPTLVVAASDDPIVPPWAGAVLARCVRNGRRIVLAGGHLLPIERPGDVADLLHGFFV